MCVCVLKDCRDVTSWPKHGKINPRFSMEHGGTKEALVAPIFPETNGSSQCGRLKHTSSPDPILEVISDRHLRRVGCPKH